MSRANKTFLWISITLRRIQALKYPSEDRIRQEIEGSSQELEELYRGLIERAFNEDPQNAIILA